MKMGSNPRLVSYMKRGFGHRHRQRESHVKQQKLEPRNTTVQVSAL
jgi:hypothetical protein